MVAIVSTFTAASLGIVALKKEKEKPKPLKAGASLLPAMNAPQELEHSCFRRLATACRCTEREILSSRIPDLEGWSSARPGTPAVHRQTMRIRLRFLATAPESAG